MQRIITTLYFRSESHLKLVCQEVAVWVIWTKYCINHQEEDPNSKSFHSRQSAKRERSKTGDEKSLIRTIGLWFLWVFFFSSHLKQLCSCFFEPRIFFSFFYLFGGFPGQSVSSLATSFL